MESVDVKVTPAVSEATVVLEAINGEGDTGDVLGCTFRHSGKDKEVVAKMPVDKVAIFYNMSHARRGTALIFNQEKFEMENLPTRSGTNVDAKNLYSCLTHLGFEVMTYHDLTTSEVDRTVQDASKMDHSDCDSFVLAILSHGEQGILYARDTPYKPENIWCHFTADRCPTLAGKPKLFFIQACQGDRLDSGITMRTQVDASPSYKIPTHADFLIAYSTVPGFYSWRNTYRGSWFMQSLCAELTENGFAYDLLTLLTFVNRRVATDFESNVPGNERMHGRKQIPCVTTMLTRILKFTSK